MAVQSPHVRCRGDTVKKVSSHRRMEFFRTAGASHERRREWTTSIHAKAIIVFVIVLQRLSAAEITKDRPSRDFRRLSIFDFFNSICQFRKWSILYDHPIYCCSLGQGTAGRAPEVDGVRWCDWLLPAIEPPRLRTNGRKRLGDEGIAGEGNDEALGFEMHAKEFHDIDGGAGFREGVGDPGEIAPLIDGRTAPRA